MEDNTTNKELTELFLNNIGLINKFANKYGRSFMYLFDTYEDMVQDFCMKVWKVLPKYDAKYKIGTFIYSVLFRHCLDKKRKDGERIKFEKNCVDNNTIINEKEETIIDCVEDYKQNAYEEIVADGIVDKLSHYMLMRVCGYSLQEIADVMHTTKGMVNKILSNERKQILSEQGE